MAIYSQKNSWARLRRTVLLLILTAAVLFRIFIGPDVVSYYLYGSPEEVDDNSELNNHLVSDSESPAYDTETNSDPRSSSSSSFSLSAISAAAELSPFRLKNRLTIRRRRKIGFDPAILINGPKLSKFESLKSRSRSLARIKSIYEQRNEETRNDNNPQQQQQPYDDTSDSDGSRPDLIALRPETYLIPGLVPPEVHYVWCDARGSNDGTGRGGRWFEYKNYLGVLASAKAIRPDKVYLHYESPPTVDRVFYNQWLDDLKRDHAWFIIRRLSDDLADRYCRSRDLFSKLDALLSLLDGEGGIFVGESTWLLTYPPVRRGSDVEMALDLEMSETAKGLEGFLMLRRGVYSEQESWSRVLTEVDDEEEDTVIEFVKGQRTVFSKNVRGVKRASNKTGSAAGGIAAGTTAFSDIIKAGGSNRARLFLEALSVSAAKKRRREERKRQEEGGMENGKSTAGRKKAGIPSDEGVVVVKEGALTKKAFPRGAIVSSCSKPQHLYASEWLVKNHSRCIVVKGGEFDNFYPMDVWQLDDSFGRLARKLFYNSEKIRIPIPKYDSLVPNIAHMIWIGGGPMDYVFYLSVLSLLFVAKVEIVYVHGDVEPTNDLWREIQNMRQTRDKVKFIVRTQLDEIFQGKLTPGYRSLMSDLIRVDLMIKYGGIYTDTDAIWVKPLVLAERGYDAVAGFDWIDWSWPFPDTVNFGISYGKRNAPFWRIFRDSMKTLRDDVHGFTGVMMPYKLLERYPELIRIDRRLQVICYHMKCHPTYYADYHNMSKDHTNTDSIPNWRQDVHAFHWTHPNPPELFNRTTLLRSEGIFAELAKNVLMQAGLL